MDQGKGKEASGRIALDQFLDARLDRQRSRGTLRTLTLREGLVDFCSNDYLGLTQHRAGLPGTGADGLRLGSGGSRLLAGNSRSHEELEAYLADFYGADAALLCNSGYCANLSVFSALPSRHDTVIHDELVHASIRDGIRLSAARHVAFRHNDLDHLEYRLTHARGARFVAVESVYSMDGDGPDFPGLLTLCERSGAILCVDEAHGVGVYGKEGRGVLEAQGISEAVPVRVYTFGKALGSFGAVVVGSASLKAALVNFSRPFMFATALPPMLVQGIGEAHECMRRADGERTTVLERVREFRARCAGVPGVRLLPSVTPIQGLVVPGNAAVTAAAELLTARGLDVRPIRSPTVAAGSERLRISIHSFNSVDEIGALCELLKSLCTTQDIVPVNESSR